MKSIFKSPLYILFLMIISLYGCDDTVKEGSEPEKHDQEEVHSEVAEAMLSQRQYEALGMQIDTLKKRLMSGYVEANGVLEVPPQNEAAVTSVYGGNVSKILVIEGEQVNKGEVLAYISHPEIVKLQTELLNAANQLKFQEQEFNRREKLYKAGVGSGEEFQRAKANLNSAKGLVNGLKAQLRLLHLDPQEVINGNIVSQIPVLSPISGAVQEVNVKTGQFVEAQTGMFEILNTEDVHADLEVFEEDISEVEVGQPVFLSLGSGEELKAEVLTIGKVFEQDPKAVHIHAEIEDQPENLVPGMYVRGKIATGNSETVAFPEDAIATEGNNFFVFKAEREGDAWSFKPVEVILGEKDKNWVEVNFISPVEPETKFTYNNAFYLMAQMNKGEGGHSH